MTPDEKKLQRRPGEGREEDINVQAICEVFGDEKNLALIRTLERSDAAMTAGELAEAADIPESTVYRKLDAIRKTPIMQSTVALSEDGPQATQYEVVADAVTLSFARNGLAADVNSRRSNDGT